MLLILTYISLPTSRRPPPGSKIFEVNLPGKELNERPVTDTNRSGKLRLVVDSGAHCGCMSSDKKGLVQVTDRRPNRQVKVADGALLKVIAIGNVTLKDLNGFKLESDDSMTPAKTTGTWHKMLIMEGLDPNTVLLSVTRMREDDGINTYFNRDNATGIGDCLKMPGGIYVPFTSDSFELHAQTRSLSVPKY